VNGPRYRRSPHPDVALGRLPVRTPAELEMVVATTTAYAAAPAASAVLASDTNDGTDYAAVNDALEALLDGWDVQRADVDRSVNAAAARADLLAAIEAGVGVTLYVGHSGPHTWSRWPVPGWRRRCSSPAPPRPDAARSPNCCRSTPVPACRSRPPRSTATSHRVLPPAGLQASPTRCRSPVPLPAATRATVAASPLVAVAARARERRSSSALSVPAPSTPASTESSPEPPSPFLISALQSEPRAACTWRTASR